MALVDLSNAKCRALVSFGAVVAGTALGCVTGGFGGKAATVIAGLFGSIWAKDLAKCWDDRSRDPLYAHPNHDLTLLIGNAVAHVLYECANDKSLANDARWFKSLAKQAEKSYDKVAAHPALTDIATDNLPELFAAAADRAETRHFPLLDQQAWGFVVEFLRDEAQLSENPDAASVAAQRLHQRVFAAIRELFKRDFSGDGRAYAALCIDMNAGILSKLGDVLQENQSTRHELISIRTLLGDLSHQHRRHLTLQQTQDLGPVLVAMGSMGHILDTVLEVVVDNREATSRIELQNAEIAKLLRDHFSPKQAGEDPTQRELPPELIEQARLLLQRGDKEQRAVAEIALRNHDHADALIQELKRSPLAEAFRLLTLEGDNWYAAGEFDRAIEPYEQALALRSDDPNALNNAAIAHSQARIDSIEAHQLRAIALLEQCAQMTRNTNRLNWAATKNNIGAAWADLPTDDRAANLWKAIDAYDAALEVYTREAHPMDWATTQYNLGNAWAWMPRAPRAANLRKAIDAYQLALQVRTREAHPLAWAITQLNLGNAWLHHPSGDCETNVCNAMDAWLAALRVYTREAHPLEWAATQNNLGIAWALLPSEDRRANMQMAIESYNMALEVYTREGQPREWACAHHGLAFASAAMAEFPGEQRCAWLRRAIASGKAALAAFTPAIFPGEHAATTENLRIVCEAYEAAGCARETPFDSIPPAD